MPNQALNAIMTKIRARYGRMLTPADFRAMASASSVPEVASFLKTRTKYGDTLAKINEAAIHRGFLEKLIRRAMYSDIESICRFERSVGDRLFSYIVGRAEADLLMSVLRTLSAGRPASEAFVPRILTRYSRLDFAALSAVTTFGDLKRLLEETEYKLAAAMIPQTGEPVDIPLCETTLDRVVYDRVLFDIDRYYGGAERDSLRDIILTQAELSDVSAIWRGKTCYGAPENMLRPETLGFRNRLSGKTFDSMLAAENGERVLELIRSSRYARYIRPEDGFPDPDRLQKRILSRKCTANIHFSASPPVVMMSYFTALEIEVANIIKVIEGVRYALPAETIMRELILEEKEE